MIEKEDYVTPKFGMRINYSGTFDFPEVRDSIKDWFKDKRYILTEKEYIFKEAKYGREVEIEWNGFRKVDEYAKFHVDVIFKIKEMKKVGSKDKGLTDLRVIGYIELDYKEKFDGFFTKFLGHVYNNFIIKEKIQDRYEPKLREETEEIRNIIKEVLELHR